MQAFLMYFLFTIIILSLFGFYYATIYNKFQSYLIRINEAESEIDNFLRDKFDLLNRAISIIKGNVKIKDEVFEDLVKLRSRKLSTFDLDRQLVTFLNLFYQIKEENPILLESKTFNSIDNELKDIDENLFAIKDYFNKHVTLYNKLVKKFPSNIISKLGNYQEKTFLDGKDMNDDDEKDFVL